MNMNRFVFLMVAASTAGSLAALAQMNQSPTAHPNGLGLSYRFGLNISAKFSGLGGFPAQTDAGPATGGGINRTYDDGFNHLDGSGNVGGLTWNWGYANASQVPGNDTVVMHSSSSPANVSNERDGDPQHGFELTYNRQLGTFAKLPWGLELAFNYMDLTIRDSQGLAAPVNRLSDAYALGGIIAPLAPYAVNSTGPGPMIGDSPTRTMTVIPGGAGLVGQRNLDATVFGWRLGPYLEIPLSSRVAFSLSGGLAVALIDSDFSFTESVTIAGVGTVSHSGSGSDDEFLWGVYLAGTFSYAVSQHVSVFAGVQYQNIGRFSQTAAGKTAELDLGRSAFVTTGLAWTF